MSSGEWISAGDAVEPQGGAQVDESSLTCSHFSGKQSPAFTFQMLPDNIMSIKIPRSLSLRKLVIAFPRHFLLYPTKNLPFTTKEWEPFFENVI